MALSVWFLIGTALWFGAYFVSLAFGAERGPAILIAGVFVTVLIGVGCGIGEGIRGKEDELKRQYEEDRWHYEMGVAGFTDEQARLVCRERRGGRCR